IMCAEELARNQSVRKIASTFDVDESTLRYRLGRKRAGAVDGRAQQQEACSPYEPVILKWIRQQEERRPSTRPEPIRALYETLQMEHGYTGSYKAVVRYVRRRAGEDLMGYGVPVPGHQNPQPSLGPCRGDDPLIARMLRSPRVRLPRSMSM
ncbi:MAG: hypothetical protein PWR28_1550, partial [Synergistaceae bacterium]|nr:hypothetical protein [Synergistaceae bacterium]